MLYIESFHSLQKGKNLLIVGMVHGNEPCGYAGIKKIINLFSAGELNLKSGSVTFCSIANPKGAMENKRFIDENLARVFDVYDSPHSYEKKLSNLLATFIIGKDAILDIHSGNAEGSRFVFQDYEEHVYADIANALGFDMVVHGWGSLYGSKPGGDITSYAHTLNIPSVVIECGQHNDPQAIDIAEKSILRFMNYYGLIEGVSLGNATEQPLHIMMDKFYYMESEGVFTQSRNHGDAIQQGTIIAEYTDGGKVIADYDCYIILPKTFANIGDEWFYLGKKMQ